METSVGSSFLQWSPYGNKFQGLIPSIWEVSEKEHITQCDSYLPGLSQQLDISLPAVGTQSLAMLFTEMQTGGFLDSLWILPFPRVIQEWDAYSPWVCVLLQCVLLKIPTFTPLWSSRMQAISLSLYLLTLTLAPSIWSVFKKDELPFSDEWVFFIVVVNSL